MGSCNSVFRKLISKKRKVTLLTVGLDNAGKSCAVRNLMNESTENVAPTVGFSKVSFQQNGFAVTVYDLGGGQSIRGIWKNYFAEVHGIVFVIDSTASHRIQECKESITNLLDNPLVSGKPLLLLANKQDIEGALDEVDICEMLDLENLVNAKKTPTRVETCSTVMMGNKQDKAIKEGFRWLIKTISLNWASLTVRVEQDLLKQKETEDQLRLERLERVRKIREEREKQENENINSSNHEKNDNDDGVTMANPFKPITEIRDDILAQEQSKKSAETQKLNGDVEKPVRTNTMVNGTIVSGTEHDKITEITSNAEIADDDSHPSRSSSRIHSPTSRVIQVTPKHSGDKSSVHLREIERNKWTPYVNTDNIRDTVSNSLASVLSSEGGGNVTTVVAQIEREVSDLGQGKNECSLPSIGTKQNSNEADTSPPSGSVVSNISSQEDTVSVKVRKKKKRNKLKQNKVIPAQTSTDDSVSQNFDLNAKLPPLKVSSSFGHKNLPLLSSFELTKSSSDSADGRIQWELAEDLKITEKVDNET